MFLKNRNISSEIKRSKVTDYAALIQNISRLVFTFLLSRSFLYFWISWLRASSVYIVFRLQSMSTLIAMKLFHCFTMLDYDETLDDLRGTCMDSCFVF